MFEKNYVERLRLWRELRESIETCDDPLAKVVEFWNTAPIFAISLDPYNPDTWPTPWEMIQENQYCDFKKILAIYYTLQLSERFSQSSFEIHIVLDKKESAMRYLLFVDNQAIGYYYDKCIDRCELPAMECQIQYNSLPTY